MELVAFSTTSVELFVGELRYVFKYKSYVEKLRSQLGDLKTIKQTMEQTLKIAKRQGDGIFDDVEQFLSKMNEFIARADKLVDEEEDKAENNRCFIGLFPNFRSRHKLSRKALKAAKDAELLCRDVRDFKFDIIWRSLVLSGPKDFAIPATACEARKARSSSDAAISLQSRLDKRLDLAEDPDLEFEAKVMYDELRNGITVSKKGFGLAKTVNGSGPSAGISDGRPPALAPPLTKKFRQSVVDDVSSTKDVMKSFAPESDDEDFLHSPVQVGFVNSLDEVENTVRVRETNVVVESGPYISNHDDHDDKDDDDKNHAVSVTVELAYNISANGKFRRKIMSWQKGEFLGSGSFGIVYEGFTDHGFFFAVKEVSLRDQGNQGKQSILQLEQEISLLSQFEHENIVQYFGTDKDENMLYIFLELVPKGSLASLYQKYHLRDSQVSAYTRQILNGLKYLHEQNVIHRDIKCANILVDASGSVKLADFGLAKETKMNDVKSSKGTLFWMAPEVVNPKNFGYGLAADIWSLGCTVLEMLTRRHPYSQLDSLQALFRIGRGELPPIPNSLSRDARDFILKCLQVNPNDRPTASQLMDHPFVMSTLQTSSGPSSPLSNIMQP